MKRIMIMAILLVLVSPLAAAKNFRSSGYQYMKELPISKLEPGKDLYYRFTIDGQIRKNSGERDLRLVAGGLEIPYFKRRAFSEASDSRSTYPQVIFRKKARNQLTLVLKLPELTEGREYRSLEVRSKGHFEVSVSRSYSKTPDSWKNAGSSSLYRYSGTSRNLLSIDPGQQRFVRLKFHSKADFSVPRAFFRIKGSKKEYSTKVDISDLGLSLDNDTQATVIDFNNEMKRNISRVELTFQESRFDRRVTIYSQGLKNRSFSSIGSARIYSKNEKGQTVQIINLPSRVTSQLRFKVHNDDDQPLTLTGYTAVSPVEEVIFEVPAQVDASATVRLYYGNTYAQPASYDIRDTFDKNLPLRRLALGKETENPDYSWSFLEPPVSTWIIRLIYFAMLAAVLFAAWKVAASGALGTEKEA